MIQATNCDRFLCETIIAKFFLRQHDFTKKFCATLDFPTSTIVRQFFRRQLIFPTSTISPALTWNWNISYQSPQGISSKPGTRQKSRNTHGVPSTCATIIMGRSVGPSGIGILLREARSRRDRHSSYASDHGPRRRHGHLEGTRRVARPQTSFTRRMRRCHASRSDA